MRTIKTYSKGRPFIMRLSLPIMLRERRSLRRPSGEEVRAPNGIHRNSIRLINRLRSSVWNIDVMIAVSELLDP